MMNNIIVLPLIIPIITGILLVFLRDQHKLQKVVTGITLLFMVIISGILLQLVQTKGIIRLDFSGWAPPFGILFVADTFSVLLVLTSCIVALACMLFAFGTVSENFEKMYFYPFVLFLMAGVNGSFLTGDIFNLFVCFEVMLLASYVLVTIGGGRVQLRESLKYIVINVVASWIFLIALAFLYGTLKTLNMAHIAVRVAEAGQDPLLITISFIFLIVFAIKAGLMLFFWLPGAYEVPVPAIQALFAGLLTKVGIYAIIRTFTLMFPMDTQITQIVIGVMACITVILGCFGALGAKDIVSIAIYNVIIGVGFILIGFTTMKEEALAGVVYYLMHDMFAKAMLFLIIGMMVLLTGETIAKKMSGLIRNYPLLGWMYFIVMCALIGIPPLSGFFGKVLIGQGLIESNAYILLIVGFGSTLIVLYSLLRIFLASFFGETVISEGVETPVPKVASASFILLAGFIIALGLGAEWMAPYITNAAENLLNPSQYIEAVLSTTKIGG